MNTKMYFVAIALAAILTGCATVSKNPQQDIVGVWELTKALNLRPCDAGFVENIKLVFQPDGTLYKIGPKQSKLGESAELNRYSYKIDGNVLIRTKSEQEGYRAPFSLRGKTLIITEVDGELIHYRKHTSDFTLIPVWEPRTVPFTVNYEKKKGKVVHKEHSEAIIPLATVQELKRARIDCWDLEDRLAVFITDDTQDVAGILDYGNLSKQEALAIVKAKKKELDKILDDEAMEHNERVRRNQNANNERVRTVP